MSSTSSPFLTADTLTVSSVDHIQPDLDAPIQTHEISKAAVDTDKEQLPVIDDDANDEVEYPDGGLQAWLVVAGSFVAQFVVLGNVYSFGIYNQYYADAQFGSSAQVAFIGSLGMAFIYILGLPSSKLAERYGFRQVIFAGLMILCLGLFLASFITSLPLLILTQGIMFGIGSSFIFFPAVSLPAQWFLKRRGLAMGISVSGSGLGGLLFAQLSQRLLDTIGREWTLRVTCIISLVLMLPLIPFMKTRIPPRKGSTGFSFLKNPGFYCLLGACFFGAFAEFVPVDFITVFAKDRLGTSKNDGATLLSIYNGCNMVGRIVLGIVSDNYLGPLNAMVVYLDDASNYLGLCALSAAIGLFDGGFWTLFPIAVEEICGIDGSMVTMLAILYTFMTIAVFGTPPLSGFIQAEYGFDWMIIYAGALAILQALSSTGAKVVFSRRR
ncbi:hypothetical protein HDU99_002766 [Rhizoclosmatium hyalinum]|nr:hypothetical protein HDU99_002766 [Rhizoclosmatium hyalinum]